MLFLLLKARTKRTRFTASDMSHKVSGRFFIGDGDGATSSIFVFEISARLDPELFNTFPKRTIENLVF